jgi:phosphoribosyl 1,2-cyclic phosphodiesterase
VPVNFTILGSGSGGNCAYCETEHTRVLIDAGFSLRQIRQRLASIGRTPENLDGILITHEHSDHVQALRVLCDKLQIPIYCNRLTSDAIRHQTGAVMNCRIFETGSTFEIGDVIVETFSVPHDAQDPVGFLLRTPSANIGFLTDLGHATKLVIERVRNAHCLVLEANHDIKMLQECPHRPWSLKQRILGRHGHLSNAAAAEAATQVITADLKRIFLGHLSSECNKPELARDIVAERLCAIGATHVALEVASQSTPTATMAL